MYVGEWIVIPVLVGTKGGGKRRVARGEGRVVYIGEKFITVFNGSYNVTFTPAELRAEGELIE